MSEERLVILMPVFNDWASFRILYLEIDTCLAKAGIEAEIVVVDDASDCDYDIPATDGLQAIDRITVIVLKRNMGHQRAIAIGLSYIADRLPCAAVLVMDSDGEDTPADAVRLMEACRSEQFTKVVFACRARRSEGIVFRLFYAAYRWVFKRLTAQEIRFGNFSIIPQRLLNRIVGITEIWNHYSAGVMKSRIRYTLVDTERGRRLAGDSRMSIRSLITHGLSSISIYSEVVGTRLFLLAMGAIVVLLLGIAAVIAIRLFTPLAIPGWASYAAGLLALMVAQACMFCLLFLFLILSSRNAITMIPQKDYQAFIFRTDCLVRGDGRKGAALGRT